MSGFHASRVSRGVALLALFASNPCIAAGLRTPSLEEIVQIRDLDSISIAPDGRSIVYREQMPSLRSNRISAQWYRLGMRKGSRPEPIGGLTSPIYIPDFDFPLDGVIHWPAGGGAPLALLERDGRRQVYRLGAAGQMTQVTHDAGDVEDFDINADQRSITIQVRDPVDRIRRAQELENSTGVHFDRTVFSDGLRLTDNFKIGDRVTTVRRQPPPGVVDIGVEAFRGELRTKHIALPADTSRPNLAAARKDAGDMLEPRSSDALARLLELGPGRGSAGLARDARGASGSLIVQYHAPGGRIVECDADMCRRPTASVRGIFVLRSSGEVIVQSEPHATGRTGIYGWTPATGTVRTIVEPTTTLTGGSLFGYSACPIVEGGLICIQAGPTLPPRLVRVDLADGRISVLDDPNRSLAAEHFEPVRFLDWKDAAGHAATGVLMLPADVPHPLPLVITSYTCRGFLRGGTGMTVVEPLLAERGIATLCVNYNDDLDDAHGPDGKIIPAGQVKGAVAAYRAIIAQLSEAGVIDPARVGIAGHSLSGNAVAYAISHTNLFAAAMMSTGSTFDPLSYLVTAPTADSWRKDGYAAQGLPRPDADPTHILNDISPALNASKIRAATLFQPPEDEWLFALQLFSSIQYAGGVSDMYVYPFAGHDPNRLPSHHFWRNRRALDWFDYWLKTAPDQPTRKLSDFYVWLGRRSPDTKPGAN